MDYDISHLLKSWPYHPGEVSVRRFIGRDGREKIQMRVDLGILQMNTTGRPDGKRPFGFSTLFGYYNSLLRKHMLENNGNDRSFLLDPKDCAELQMEMLQYHNRSICMLQLQDYEAVLRDTQRNFDILDFVEAYAITDDLAWSVVQFWPQVVIIRVRAEAAMAVELVEDDKAIKIVERGIQELRDFYTRTCHTHLIERSNEIVELTRLIEDIRRNKPLTIREQFQKLLEAALRVEDYEEAARLRDGIRRLDAISQKKNSKRKSMGRENE